MSVITLPQRRTRQPQSLVRVSQNSPFANALTFLHTPVTLNDQAGNDYSLDRHANVAIQPHDDEVCWVTTNTNGEDLSFNKAVSVGYSESFTAVVRLKLLPVGAEDTAGGAMVLRDGSSGTPIIGIYVGQNGVSTSAYRALFLIRTDGGSLVHPGTVAPLLNDGKFHTLALRRDADGFCAWSVDGSAWSGFAGATLGTFTFSNPAGISYGNDVLNTGIGNLNAAFSFGAFWRRALSDYEIKGLHDNPWQIFEPRRRALYFDGSGAGGGATPISASDALTPTLTESQASLLLSSVSDTLTPSVTETLQILKNPELITATDALTPNLGEAVALLALASVSDALTPSITDSSSVDTGGAVSITAFDTLTPALTESQQSTLYVTVLDALTATLGETQGSLLFSTVTDVLPVSVSENVSVLVARTASDTLLVSITDTGSVNSISVIEKTAADSLTPYFTLVGSYEARGLWTTKPAVVSVWVQKPNSNTDWTEQ